MGYGDVRLLRTIRSVDFTGQERAALNKLTMPCGCFANLNRLRVSICLNIDARCVGEGITSLSELRDTMPFGDHLFHSTSSPVSAYSNRSHSLASVST